jgi:hypothetical protein
MKGTGGGARRSSPAVNGVFERNGLRKRNGDGLSFSHPHIKFIGEGDRTLPDTIGTGCTFGHVDITGFFPQGHSKMASLSFDLNYL